MSRSRAEAHRASLLSLRLDARNGLAAIFAGSAPYEGTDARRSART
jgi:hypothetical protein